VKVSDYIVWFLEKKGITDIFGYPGIGCGHFMDSLSRSSITSHLVYHEQAAAFAACSYAQASHKVGIAYTTAGPGGTNLITGIANAYCDSIPTIFLVGDKDLSSLRNSYHVRQRASQEIDIVDIAMPTTKWSYQVKKKSEIKQVLEQAYFIAQDGRPGPVLLDIPSDIQRDDIVPDELVNFEQPPIPNYSNEIIRITDLMNRVNKPIILVGNGVKQAGLEELVLKYAEKHRIPIVTTLVCFDLYPENNNYIGYIGLDGDKAANIVVNEADLVISLGARLNFKQVSNNRKTFASKATIIRIDADSGELEYRLNNEIAVCANLTYLLPNLFEKDIKDFSDKWLNHCLELKGSSSRGASLNTIATEVVKKISLEIPVCVSVTVDTGSHRRWVMSSFKFKKGQRMYQSAGLVSMGYSLPAAIGVSIATGKPTICFDGDGGLMMNLQELQMIRRDNLPITIILMNNECLGDIMEFQKKIFKGNYYITTKESGYLAADFKGIANAFGFEYIKIENDSQINIINELLLTNGIPKLIEILVPSNTR